jgi:hypothetical protein
MPGRKAGHVFVTGPEEEFMFRAGARRVMSTRILSPSATAEARLTCLSRQMSSVPSSSYFAGISKSAPSNTPPDEVRCRRIFLGQSFMLSSPERL